MVKAKATRTKATKTTKTTKTNKVTPARTTKRPVSRKTTAKRTQTTKQPNFFTFSPSIQTVYWIIIGVLVISLTAWVMQLNAKVQHIYDQIDANSMILTTDDALITSEPKQKYSDH